MNRMKYERTERALRATRIASGQAKYFLGRNQRHLVNHVQYSSMSANDLFMMLTPKEIVFCENWIRTDCNASRAAFIAFYDGDMGRFKSEQQMRQVCSVKGMSVLKVPLVSTYLYKLKRKTLDLHQKKLARSFNKYVDKFEEIRDLALSDSDYGAAIRAHKELGILTGHSDLDSNSVDKQSDVQMLRQIAESNEEIAKLLARQMGVKEKDLELGVIEGELVEEASDSEA